MELGVVRGTVRLVPYQEGWKQVFLLEKKLLERVFGRGALAIEHIGSTAIEGLQAKPLIDIAVQVASLTSVQSLETKLTAIGYTERVNRLEGPQRVFAKADDQYETHHLHIIQADYPEWNRKVLFRDYLRRHEDARREYEALKLRLCQLFGDNRRTYSDLKKDFIASVVEKAMQENKEKG